MTAADDPERDPGWPRGPGLFVFMIPGGLQWQLGHSKRDGLTTLRQVTVSFIMMIALIGVVLAFLQPKSENAWPWVIAIIAIACISVVATHFVNRPLDCTSPTTLATTYRSRFFLRVAFAESVSLCGFVFAFTGAGLWTYYPAAAFAIVRIWTSAAPTLPALVAEQRMLEARGCQLSLVAALRTVPLPNRGG